MTWARIKTTGSGQLAWRVSIEGWPFEFVSHRGMERTAPDGRERVVGLRSEGLRFTERVDLVRATHEAGGQTIRIADVDKRATEAFAKRPQRVTHLDEPTGELTDSATTINVKSTAGFASSGRLHIDQEAIEYAATTATAFTGCTRSRWDTQARYHYSPDGRRQRFPEVTDIPQVLEGRRVRIYVYGSADDKQGDGTRVWQGIVRTEPRFNGVEWSFGADSIASVLDQDIGSDLAEPAGIRGIYYPASAPLLVSITEHSSSGRFSSASARVQFAIAGFWESQAAFTAALTTEIAAQVAAPDVGSFTQTNVFAVEEGDGWGIRFETEASPRYMTITALSATDDLEDFPYAVGVSSDRLIASVDASRAYVYPSAAHLGLVPRTTYGQFPAVLATALALAPARLVDVDPATHPPFRIYLGDETVVSAAATALVVDWESNGVASDSAGQQPFTVSIAATDATNRHVTTLRPSTVNNSGPPDAEWYAAVGGDGPEIRLARNYGVGSLATFLTALADDAPRYVNLGAVPDFRHTDFVAGEIAEVADLSPLTSRRTYSVADETSLRELVEHECRLLGVYPAVNVGGQLTFRKLRLPVPSDVGVATLTKANIVVDDEFLAYEKSALGMFNTYVLRTGYDPVEQEHTGRVYKVRDIASFGLAPKASVIEVAPLSGDPRGSVLMEDVVRTASRVLGVFGAPYAFMTVSVPLTFIDVLVGDVVSITWSKAPADDGTLGVTDKLALVVSRDFSPTEGTGELTVLVTDQRVGGYAPAAKIDTITGASGGTSFTLLLDTDYLPAGTNATNWWAVDDLIRVYRWNSVTPGTTLGTVTGVVANQVLITTATNWTHSGSTWALGSRVSTAIAAASQKRFAFLARADGTVDFSGVEDRPAFTFAP